MFPRLFCLLISLLVLSCGGGGTSSDENPQPNPPVVPSPEPEPEPASVGPLASVEDWQELMNVSHTQLTETQLRDAYWGHALNEYNGILDPVILQPQSAQRFYILLRDWTGSSKFFLGYEDVLKGAGIEPYTLDVGQLASQGQVSADIYLECEEYWFLPVYDQSNPASSPTGYIHLATEMNNGMGDASLEYTDCEIGNMVLNGKSFIRGYPVVSYGNWNAFHGTDFFESLHIAYGETRPGRSISGYYEYSASFNEDDSLENMSRVDAMVSVDDETGEALLRKLIISGTSMDAPAQLSGHLAISSLGSVEVEYEIHAAPEDITQDFSLRTFHLLGQNGTRLSVDLFRYGYSLVSLDSDGDGLYDSGRYYLYQDFFRDVDLEAEPLKLYSEINHPPVIRYELLHFSVYPDFGNDAVIDMPNGMYFDPDTPFEELNVSFIWEVNGQLVPEVTSLTFPGDMLEEGDHVQFYFTVSDGVHTIESNRIDTSVVF